MADRKRAFLVDYALLHMFYVQQKTQKKEAVRGGENNRKTKHVSRFFVSILKVDPFVKLMRQNGGPPSPHGLKRPAPG